MEDNLKGTGLLQTKNCSGRLGSVVELGVVVKVHGKEGREKRRDRRAHL